MSKNTMRLLFIITTLPFLFALTANADLAIVSQSNKQNYVCGEPIILHMTVQTGANEHSFKSRYGLGWGKAGVFGFSLEIARDGGDYLDVLSHLPYASRVSKGFDEFFRDRYPIPILIPSNTTFSRIDMLLLKPGNYKLRAVILDIDKRRYVSNEITMTVNPVEGHDSIERMGNSDYAWRLGHNIFNEQYVQSMTSELMSEEFLSACDTILNDYQDSVFYPYVLFAMVEMHLYQRMSPGPTDAQKEQALGKYLKIRDRNGTHWKEI